MGKGRVLAALLTPLAACGTAAVAAERPAINAFAGQLLAAHNSERDSAGVPRLEWDGVLAQQAQAWADQLAREGMMRHSTREIRGRTGENLWMGSAGRYDADGMVGAFVNEKRLYQAGVFPAVSKTGNWQDVGHYTQLIWRDTRQVGCAVARGRDNDFLVCRYFPAGNYLGRAAR